MYYQFDLHKIPFYYVSGLFVGTQPWLRKKLIQPGNYSLLIVLGGILYLSIDGQYFTVRQNEYLIVPAFKKARGFKKIPVGTRYIWVHFFPQEKPMIDNDYARPNETTACLPQHGKLYNPPLVIEHAMRTVNAGKIDNRYYADLAVASLLLLLSEDYGHLQKSRRLRVKRQGIAESIHHYLTVHFLEINHLEELRDVWGFSVPYLNRKFKARYNCSLYEYLIRQRLEFAKRRLILSHDPVYQVASQSHFPDSKNFSRAFKQRVGVSPAQYRKLFENYRISTPNYDPVIPVSDKIMHELMKKGLTWPKKE